MSPVKFDALQVALKQETEYATVRDMLRSLAKILCSNPSRVMRDFDTITAENPDLAYGDAFMVAGKLDLQFDIYVTTKKMSIGKLLRSDYHNEDLIKYCFKCLGQSAKEELPALILCRLNHLGIFVCHNIDMYKTPTPRIVIPASKDGIQELTIQSLNNFEIDWRKIDG